MNFTKIPMTLYYRNIPPISIIKCCQNFYKIHQKKLSLFTVHHYIKCVSLPVNFREKIRILYYTNAPPICIIKWPWIFSTITLKKVLLHTCYLAKSTYVVRSYVGDFILRCNWHLIWYVMTLWCHFWSNTSFQLELSVAHCDIWAKTSTKITQF